MIDDLVGRVIELKQANITSSHDRGAGDSVTIVSAAMVTLPKAPSLPVVLAVLIHLLALPWMPFTSLLSLLTSSLLLSFDAVLIKRLSKLQIILLHTLCVLFTILPRLRWIGLGILTALLLKGISSITVKINDETSGGQSQDSASVAKTVDSNLEQSNSHSSLKAGDPQPMLESTKHSVVSNKGLVSQGDVGALASEKTATAVRATTRLEALSSSGKLKRTMDLLLADSIRLVDDTHRKRIRHREGSLATKRSFVRLCLPHIFP